MHRYINEDAPTCVSLMISLGKLAGVPMLLSEALVRVASVLNGVDYYGQGRTLENLGLSGITVKELNAYLAEGEM
jgi:opine dehydrogenase